MDWREILNTAWKSSGRSKRNVSLAAGLHAGFLHEVITSGKTPSADNLAALARELNVSITLNEENAA